MNMTRFTCLPDIYIHYRKNSHFTLCVFNLLLGCACTLQPCASSLVSFSVLLSLSLFLSRVLSLHSNSFAHTTAERISKKAKQKVFHTLLRRLLAIVCVCARKFVYKQTICTCSLVSYSESMVSIFVVWRAEMMWLPALVVVVISYTYGMINIH